MLYAGMFYVAADTDACALWSLSVHGSYVTARRPGKFEMKLSVMNSV